MKNSIPAPISIGAVVVVLLVALAFGWHSMTDNGETRNPNVGKPTRVATGRVFTGTDTLKETEEDYMKSLKLNRPELSDSEVKAMADQWWRLRTGGK